MTRTIFSDIFTENIHIKKETNYCKYRFFKLYMHFRDDLVNAQTHTHNLVIKLCEMSFVLGVSRR